MTTLGTRTSCWLSERDLVARLLGHIDAGTTDLGPKVGRVPVEHYRDPARFAAELALLRRVPAAFCASAALPRTGSYQARTAAGVPLLVVRGRDGTVRAFRNSCGHRGTALADGTGCASAFVCPFHGWTYALDGSLAKVPHADGFADVDLAERRLPEVACRESSGLVWVDQDGPGTFEGIESLTGLTSDQILVGQRSFPVATNWKVLVEGFLEGYHIRSTHPTTFLPFGYDNVTALEQYGPHSRITFPFQRIEELRDQPPEFWHSEGVTTVVEHLFPNAVIPHLSSHRAVIVIEPVDVGLSQMQIAQFTTPAADGSVPTSAQRDIEFVELGLAEDRAMALEVQRGLAARSGDVVFARYESALTHFHDGLAARL
ncbi:MAG: aromatic ring-hydroxylating oxygenase subunit alpha [Sporichthyaceae bacterium]